MKLVRFSRGSEIRLGAISDGYVVDLANGYAHYLIENGMPRESASAAALSRLSNSMRAFLAAGSASLEAAAASIEAARSVRASRLVRDVDYLLDDVALLPPVGDPQKIICVGQNYRDHCAEQNQPLPESPILFSKFATGLIGHGALIRLPAISKQVDYEAELAVVIGKRGVRISEANAPQYIAGYMCLNDVSARDLQFGDKQWVRGKSLDTFAPTGPALTTADEISDPHNLDISLTLNDTVMQSSNTSNLVFGVFNLISYISQAITLEPGDIITTGTPGGVGIFRKPPILLGPGDVVSVTIQGLGTLTNAVCVEGDI